MTARDTFDLSLSRTIRVPRAEVFDAFVMPELLRKRFGPRGHTIVGAAVSMADLLLAPSIFYLGMFPEGKTLLAGVPNVTRAHAWMAERPSIKATMPPLA